MMVGELDGLGDAVTGAMLGRAAEPATGRDDGHTHEVNCLNCGAPLAGAYCARCGQKAHVHRSLRGFGDDLLHGVLHFEGKVWNTLPLLAWRPGELTRRYIDGQRASFVSPVALFLFAVFLLFAVGGLTGSDLLGTGPSSEMRRDMAAEVAQNRQKIAIVERQREAAAKAGQPTADYDSKLAEMRREAAAVSVLNGDRVEDPVEVDSDGLPSWLAETVDQAKANPELVLYKLKTSAYKYSWALIPLSVPFVWLLFPFSRRFRLYDHVVFVTYSLCFMSLLAIAGMLLGWAGMEGFTALLILVPPFHMYRQLKGTYGLSRFGALWRTSLLTIFAFVAAGLFISIVAGIGIAA